MAVLIGFVSQKDPSEAYIHLVGTDPGRRGRGRARALYEHFFAEARRRGCARVKAITSPKNAGSIAFHRAMGFEAATAVDYSGPGEARVVFVRPL